MSVESHMREAIELLRGRGHQVTGLVADAITSEDKVTQHNLPGSGATVVDGQGPDGKPDPNPNTGAGSEPGTDFLVVDGVVFLEDVFEDCESGLDVTLVVEAALP